MRIRTIAFLVLSALAAIPAFALPTNLVKGGDFDVWQELANWSSQVSRTSEATDIGASWIGIDALGSPDSGSMQLTGAGRILQCIAVAEGVDYDFGARIMVKKPALGTIPAASARLTFFSDSQCSATSLSELNTSSVATPGRFTAVGSMRQQAPKGAHSALISIVIAGPALPPGSRLPSVYVDDVYVQESSGCAADERTLCLAGGKLRATLTVFDANDQPIAAPATQLSDATGYFFTYSADDPEVTIKAIDLSDGGSGKWIVIGGLTNLKLEVVVEDLVLHQTRRFANPSGRFLEPIIDLFSEP